MKKGDTVVRVESSDSFSSSFWTHFFTEYDLNKKELYTKTFIISEVTTSIIRLDGYIKDFASEKFRVVSPALNYEAY